MSSLVQHSQFTQLGDYFKISIYSQVASAEISVAGRLRSMHDEFSNFDHRITISATGAQTVYRPASGAWWIMSCVASVVSGTVNPGDILIKVELTQGQAPGNVPHQVLLFGSPDSFAPLTMGSPGEFSVDGRRTRIAVSTISDPVVNTAGIFTVPDGVKWQVIWGIWAIDTIAVTGEAYPQVSAFLQDTDTLYVSIGGQATGPGASQTVYIIREGSALSTSVGPQSVLSIPGIDLYPGDTVYYEWHNNTGNVQVTGCEISVEETILGY